MKGILTFHSETGTEGGYWAFQDEKFMGIPAPDVFKCINCGRIWDKSKQTEEPKVSFSYWIERGPKDKSPEGYRYLSGYMGYDRPQDLPEAPPKEDKNSLNNVWTHALNEITRKCYENGHEGWELLHPNGTWSYEGLHVLENGDSIRVYDKNDPTKLIWEGIVELDKFTVFKDDYEGWWIHNQPKNMKLEEWAKWFLEEWPATLNE
jgi:hypothetical protein